MRAAGASANEAKALLLTLAGWLQGHIDGAVFEAKLKAEADAYAKERVKAERGVGFRRLPLTESVNAGIAQCDAVLIGRRTYLEFAELWPPQGSEVPMSDFLNNSHKYVASRTLGKLDWGPASLLRGDLADELLKLKQQPGKNITVPGSPRLVRSLLQDRLLDDLTLAICPIVDGRGLRLFEEVMVQLPLTVVQSATEHRCCQRDLSAGELGSGFVQAFGPDLSGAGGIERWRGPGPARRVSQP